jgi:hypothetical protein
MRVMGIRRSIGAVECIFVRNEFWQLFRIGDNPKRRVLRLYSFGVLEKSVVGG